LRLRGVARFLGIGFDDRLSGLRFNGLRRLGSGLRFTFHLQRSIRAVFVHRLALRPEAPLVVPAYEQPAVPADAARWHWDHLAAG